jgi:hypothetical protein
MTQAEIDAAISPFREQLAELQEKQEKQTRDWLRLAIRSGWLSITCVWLGAIFARRWIQFLHDGGYFDLAIHARKRATGHSEPSPWRQQMNRN